MAAKPKTTEIIDPPEATEVVVSANVLSALTTTSGGAVSSFLAEDIGEMQGAGISDRAEDFLLPFLYVAQSNSPQVKKQHASYIPGLEAGDIFNTATGRFWKGDTGLVVIPAFFQKAEVEWVPRSAGGGYVATHPIDTPLAKQVQTVDRVRLLNGGKTQLVETAYHFVVLPEDGSIAVVGMASTNLQSSRGWNTMMKDQKIRGPKGDLIVAPSFAVCYTLRTAYRTNDRGDWFQFVVERPVWVGEEQRGAYMIAREFFKNAAEKGVQLGRPPEADVADTSAAAGHGPLVDAEPGDEGDEPPI